MKRQSLITTALDEFARAGFHAASLREIAHKAQVSSRTLYNHYPDKLALFEACLEYSGRQIQPVLPDFNGNLHARLVAYSTEMQRQLSDHISMQITKLIYRECSDSEQLRKIAKVQFERYQVSPVARILEQEGLPAERCRGYAMQFVAMAFSELQRRLLFGELPMTEAEMVEQADLVTTIFLNGIR